MQIKKEMTAQQAFQRLAALCAKGEHCQHDLLEKMRQWGVSPEEQAEVMERLVGGRYVDDERFARAFVSDKVRFAKWGRRKVEQALWMKRIDKAIAQQVLDEVGDDEYISTLKPQLRQKQKTLRGKAAPEGERRERVKLINFALSRGYTMDIIRQCIDVADEDEFLD